MRRAGIQPRRGQGFPWAYGPGEPALPAATRHGYTPPVPVQLWSSPAGPFPLVLTGNPLHDVRPRGPWVTGPGATFPLPAGTGQRMYGGQGTDMTDPSTWQRAYQFTPPGTSPAAS